MKNPPQIEDYTLGDLIAEGSTGRVYAAEFQGESKYAVKVLDPRAINRELIFDVLVKLLNKAPHPGINTVYDFDLAGSEPYIVTEFHADRMRLDNGEEYWEPRTLETICGRLTKADAWQVIYQIADALSHLHRLRAPHCGLKTTNILLDEDNPPGIRITDAGQGFVGGAEHVLPGDSICSAPPEQFRNPESMDGGAAERWDVYSFGVVAYQVLTGKYPRIAEFIEQVRSRKAAQPNVKLRFDLEAVSAMIEREPEISWPSAAESDTEEMRRSVIESCLRLEPESRYLDMREVREAFSALEDRATHESGVASLERANEDLSKRVRKAKRKTTLLAVASLGFAAVAGWFGFQAHDGKRDGSATHAHEDGDDGGGTETRNGGRPTTPELSPVPSVELRAAIERAESAEESLRQTSEAVDEVFGTLVSRDSTGAAIYAVPEGALGSILSYYEEIAKRYADDPEMLLPASRALSSAGEIKLALGDANQAIADLSRACSLTQPAYEADQEDGTLLYYLAFYKRSLANAQREARQPKASLDSAGTASELFKTLSNRNPSSAQAKRALVQSYIFEGQGLIDADRAGEAGLVLDRAQTVLTFLEQESGQTEADIAALSRIDFERARIERANGARGDAIDFLIASVDRLLDPLLKSQPDSPLYRFRLAEAYADLSDLVAEEGAPDDAREANDQAIGLLAELTDEAPENIEFRRRLAGRFIALSSLERDAGKNPDARTSTAKAIALLDDLIKHATEKPEIKHDMAMARRRMADLLIEANKKDEALKEAQSSVQIMQELLNDDLDPESGNTKRPEYRIAVATLYGQLGRQCEGLSRKEDARVCFEKAVRQWEFLSGSQDWADDEEVTKGLSWSKERLAKLSDS